MVVWDSLGMTACFYKTTGVLESNVNSGCMSKKDNKKSFHPCVYSAMLQ